MQLYKQLILNDKGDIPASVVIRVVTNDNSVITRTPSEDTTVTNMMLHVANHSSFRNRSERQHIANNKSSLFPTIHELTSVHTLGGHEQLVLLLVSEGVAESDPGERCTATRVVNDLSDHALQVPIALTKVEAAEPCWSLAMVGMGLEHRPSTLTLSSDYTTHCSFFLCPLALALALVVTADSEKMLVPTGN